MPYILNTQKGASLIHPELGKLPPLTATEIDENMVYKFRGLRGTVLFDKVLMNVKRKQSEVIKKYSDFFAEAGGNGRTASLKWEAYKKEKGLGI